VAAPVMIPPQVSKTPPRFSEAYHGICPRKFFSGTLGDRKHFVSPLGLGGEGDRR